MPQFEQNSVGLFKDEEVSSLHSNDHYVILWGVTAQISQMIPKIKGFLTKFSFDLDFFFEVSDNRSKSREVHFISPIKKKKHLQPRCYLLLYRIKFLRLSRLIPHDPSRLWGKDGGAGRTLMEETLQALRPCGRTQKHTWHLYMQMKALYRSSRQSFGRHWKLLTSLSVGVQQ